MNSAELHELNVKRFYKEFLLIAIVLILIFVALCFTNMQLYNSDSENMQVLGAIGFVFLSCGGIGALVAVLVSIEDMFPKEFHNSNDAVKDIINSGIKNNNYYGNGEYVVKSIIKQYRKFNRVKRND